MNKFKILLISMLFIFIPFSGIQGSEPNISESINPKKTVFLRIKSETSKIVTLTGDFVQKKEIEILKDVPESRGKFFYKKPDCLRWEITEPVKMGFIVNGNQGKKWRSKVDRFKKFDVSKEPIISVITSQVFAWAEGDFEKLNKGYEISVLSESPIKLKLLPLSSIEKKYIASIILSFSEDDNYVEDLEINETRGGRTQIIFYNMVTNDQLEEDIF